MSLGLFLPPFPFLFVSSLFLHPSPPTPLPGEELSISIFTLEMLIAWELFTYPWPWIWQVIKSKKWTILIIYYSTEYFNLYLQIEEKKITCHCCVPISVLKFLHPFLAGLLCLGAYSEEPDKTYNLYRFTNYLQQTYAIR